MNDLQIVELIVALLFATVLLTLIARRLHIPYPILFVLGGLALSLVPGLPPVALPPDLLFLVFIPPLVYSAAVSISPQEIRTYWRPFAMLAIALVIVTTAVVAFIAHTFIGMDWAPAAALGAIVSSTDATAVSAISERLPLPTPVVTILEGESLFNDATGLVLYRLAIAAAMATTVSISELSVQFVLAAVGGIAIGLIVGWLAVQLRRRIDDDDPVSEITIGLLIPFAAWIAADQAGFSGVLAVATAAILVGRVRLVELSPISRRWGSAFWQVTTFLLEGLLFILVGLQGRSILAQINLPVAQLVGYAVIICVAVVVVRIVGVFISAYAIPTIGRAVEPSIRYPSWRRVIITAWAGMRGGESLAPALALPIAGAGGAPFPNRSLIIFLTFAVILATLVLQGLSLPRLIRWLGLANRAAEREESNRARAEMARAALARLDELSAQTHAPTEIVQSVRSELEHRIHDLSGPVPQAEFGRDRAEQQLRERVIGTEREKAQQLAENARISDEVWRALERELDLQELALDASAKEAPASHDGQPPG